jgi:hypothetical protein
VATVGIDIVAVLQALLITCNVNEPVPVNPFSSVAMTSMVYVFMFPTKDVTIENDLVYVLNYMNEGNDAPPYN